MHSQVGKRNGFRKFLIDYPKTADFELPTNGRNKMAEAVRNLWFKVQCSWLMVNEG